MPLGFSGFLVCHSPMSGDSLGIETDKNRHIETIFAMGGVGFHAWMPTMKTAA